MAQIKSPIYNRLIRLKQWFINIIFRYHYLVLSFMQDEETELELDIGEEELQVSSYYALYYFSK